VEVEETIDRDLAARCLELFSAEERARHRRFRYDRDRRLFLVAHTLLRVTLSRFGPLPPGDWAFAANRHGKPHLVPPNGGRMLRFNLTHCAGLAACVVTEEHEVGLDAEHLGRETDPGLADRFFSPVEQAQLEGLAQTDRCRAFFDIWTLKESYVKGRGIGVSLPLRSFGFTLPSDDRGKIGFAPPLGDVAGRWSFFRVRPTAEHTLAVAVNHPPGADPMLVSSPAASLADLV
jgi:4'-phosphopantetheinyl transferase